MLAKWGKQPEKLIIFKGKIHKFPNMFTFKKYMRILTNIGELACGVLYTTKKMVKSI